MSHLSTISKWLLPKNCNLKYTQGSVAIGYGNLYYTQGSVAAKIFFLKLIVEEIINVMRIKVTRMWIVTQNSVIRLKDATLAPTPLPQIHHTAAIYPIT